MPTSKDEVSKAANVASELRNKELSELLYSLIDAAIRLNEAAMNPDRRRPIRVSLPKGLPYDTVCEVVDTYKAEGWICNLLGLGLRRLRLK